MPRPIFTVMHNAGSDGQAFSTSRNMPIMAAAVIKSSSPRVTPRLALDICQERAASGSFGGRSGSGGHK